MKDISKDFYHEDGDAVICFTVGDLIKRLKELPEDLEVKQGFDDGARLTVYNISTEPFLELEEVG